MLSVENHSSFDKFSRKHDWVCNLANFVFRLARWFCLKYGQENFGNPLNESQALTLQYKKWFIVAPSTSVVGISGII